MPKKSWNGVLGNKTRSLLETPYEGLPFDEPQFTLNYIPPKVFTGFARNSRNILWFVKDSLARFQLTEDLMAQPQVVAKVKGEDDDVQAYFLEDNIKLLKAVLTENERKEKVRRIKKSATKDRHLHNRFKNFVDLPNRLQYSEGYKQFYLDSKRNPQGTYEFDSL